MSKKTTTDYPRVLPSKIKIGGYQIAVEYINLKNDWGMGYPDDKLIQISTKLDEDGQWSTFFHECIHMAMMIGGVDSVIDDNISEGVVRCIENLLWPLLKFRKEVLEDD